MTYTVGNWNVSEGHADAFERAWQQAVGQLATALPGVVFRLLRDTERPGRYVSFGGPWSSQAQIDAASGSRAYQDAMAAAQAHLAESSAIKRYELVLEVG